MLEGLGYSVDLSGDGIDALEAIERRSYAAVLMDCQMPRMDGFTPPPKLRREAGHAHPIIALTAYATDGERERCIDAGMDDYLAKPVSKPDLARVLGQWTIRQPGCGLSPAARQCTRTRSSTWNDWQASATRWATRVSTTSIEMLMTEVADSGPAFRVLADAGTSAKSRRAHRLKGSCRVLGFDQLATVCNEFEQMAVTEMPARWSRSPRRR